MKILLTSTYPSHQFGVQCCMPKKEVAEISNILLSARIFFGGRETFEKVPQGMIDNSPAIYGWEKVATK